MAIPAEKARYTFADVLTWEETERAESIGGAVVMMAPRSGQSFQAIQSC